MKRARTRLPLVIQVDLVPWPWPIPSKSSTLSLARARPVGQSGHCVTCWCWRVFKGCVKGDSRMFQGCFKDTVKDIARVFYNQRCFKEFSKKFQGWSNDVSSMFEGRAFQGVDGSSMFFLKKRSELFKGNLKSCLKVVLFLTVCFK